MSHLWINNEQILGAGEAFEAINPANQQVLATVFSSSEAQVVKAFECARTAFKEWSNTSLQQRIEYLEGYRQLLNRDKEKLAELISLEVGKPLWESQTEVTAMINKVAISIDAYHQRTPTITSAATKLTHRPHGVLAILGPYNFPCHLPNGHIVPALLAGNTLVFKPSEQTPLTGAATAELLVEAGLPAGVINVIQGQGDVGQALLNQAVDGVLFTGSYQTGKKIHAHFGGRPEVILALEMGGNNPLIVTEMADLDAAVFTTIMSAFITAGQRCTCARRLLVPDSDWGEQFIKRLVEKTKNLKVGCYTDTNQPFMGPVINRQTADGLIAKQEEWLAKGAKPLLAMMQRQAALVTPALIDITSVADQLGDEEIFGPLLQVYRYQSFEQAVELANKTAYGLAAGLLSTDHKQQDYFYQHARAGIVNINKQLTGAASTAPFGGIGHSGNHRPSAYYAADYCAYPMASMIDSAPAMPSALPIGYE